MKIYICPRHEISVTQECEECTRELSEFNYDNLDANDRIKQIERWMIGKNGILSVSFDYLYPHLEKIMRRHIQTIEIAQPQRFIEELQSGVSRDSISNAIDIWLENHEENSVNIVIHE